MTTKHGRLRNPESFCDLIENMGDAYEAAEECFGMVYWLANYLSALTSIPVRDLVATAQYNYQQGTEIGKRQKDR